MDPHADLHLRSVRPTVSAEGELPLDRRKNRVARTGERNEEGVALRVNLVAAVLRKRRPEQALVVRQHIGPPLA